MCWNGNCVLKAGYIHKFYGPALDLHQSQKPTTQQHLDIMQPKILLEYGAKRQEVAA